MDSIVEVSKECLDDIYDGLDEIMNIISESPQTNDKQNLKDEDKKSENNREEISNDVDSELGQISDLDDDILKLVENMEANDEASFSKNDSKHENNLNGELKISEKSEMTEKDASASNSCPEQSRDNEEISTESELTLSYKKVVSVVDTETTDLESSESTDLCSALALKSCETIEIQSVISEDLTEPSDETLGSKEAEETEPIVIANQSTITNVIVDKKSEDLDVKFEGKELLNGKLDEAVEEKPKLKSTNEEESKTSVAKLGESAEDLINILKLLSPEKLEAIKSQIFNASQEEAKQIEQVNGTDLENSKKEADEKSDETMEISMKNIDERSFDIKIDDKMEIDDNGAKECKKAEVMVEDVSIKMDVDNDDDDCVILLDSDEENEVATNGKNMEQKSSVEIEPKLVRNEQPKRLECVNSNCARDSSEFIESPQFVLSFFGASRKTNKLQHVCSSCNEQAVMKFENMAEAFLKNQPIFNIEIPQKSEMVEVIDSDDEDENVESRIVPTSEKIVWNEKVEMQVENIFLEFCQKVDFKKQQQFFKGNSQKRIAELSEKHNLLETTVKKCEKMSSSMYNTMYAVNLPKTEQLTPIEITHNLESPRKETGSLKDLLTSRSQPLQAKKRSSSNALEQFNNSIKRTFNPVTISRPTTSTQKPSVSLSTTPQNKIVIKPQYLTIKQNTPKEHPHFAVRSNNEAKIQMWLPCKILETAPSSKDGTGRLYKVKFWENDQVQTVKGKNISTNSVNHKLKIGTRVIAKFTKPNAKSKDAVGKFFPGVVGEKLSQHNNNRYLVFCDSGHVLYAPPESVREIMESSVNVWEDVHENLRQFIYEYLQSQTFRQRALLNLRLGQVVKIHRIDEWADATVVDLDCSIAKMRFNSNHVCEWIYRGSKRLEPLHRQVNRGSNSNARRNDPNISYAIVDDDQGSEALQGVIKEIEEKKNTARKSTAPPGPHMRILQQHQAQLLAKQPQPAQPSAKIILNDNNIYIDDPVKITKHRHFTPIARIAAKKYVAHSCSPLCLAEQIGTLASYSPLTKPLLLCWERQIARQKAHRYVQYKAPCGRVLRNMYEIHEFLKITKCFLNVDNFDFDTDIEVLVAYDVIDKKLCPLYIPDMSCGKEGMKIPIINAFDNKPPPKLEYSAERIPMKGVHINTDPAFRACCDCTDDCVDKSKCACFQMTIQGMKIAFPNEYQGDDNISYVWKRLLNQVRTGIYECGTQCPCSKRCLNKVVQMPIQIKMQLYRTKDRGWGLESCHDIPKGTFICIYAGKLYREEDTNAMCLGTNHGDEYFAELDLIETASSLKNGYESGVVYEDSDCSDDEERASDSDSDFDARKANEEDGDFMARPKSFSGREIPTRSTRAESKRSTTDTTSKTSTDSESEGMVSMFPKSEVRNLRKLFGKNEKVYIMDAKECGNVGRYFNHCCDPNLMVQSVFVDTHDLRFPWIAFFASRVIKAGEELTWNYNYEVGSVPSKVLYCKCEAKNCRGRIL